MNRDTLKQRESSVHEMNITRPHIFANLLIGILISLWLLLFSLPSFSAEGKNISASKENEGVAIPLTLLPRDKYDMVNWAKSVEKGLIIPMESIDGEERKTIDYPKPLIIQSKMKVIADVLFSHDVHAYWLSCDNCHPAIFAEKRGGTEGLSMLAIFKGEFCGKCHNKVAFRLKECYRCHLPRNAKKREEEFSRVNYMEKIYTNKDFGKVESKGEDR